MEYNFREIEKKWQRIWKENGAYKVSNPVDGEVAKPKFYVLDMFPYPSGAGLHVGHPLGYIASDIYSRYKRLKGFNVLHPMGFDSFGLPAEQYAIETGQHPADTTEKNIQRYHEQLDNIGFSFDWSREVKTSDPSYYKWTQYIFLQLFDSWYNRTIQKAQRIRELIKIFEKEGNINYVCPGNTALQFTGVEWVAFDDKTKQDILMQYRLAYLAYGEVNWCEALGTVLANDEVVNGVSERGGHPVEKKKLHQWYLRITEYADRLLQGLEQVDFSDAMKDMQRNWIGKSQGGEIVFELAKGLDSRLAPNPSPRGEGSQNLPAQSGNFFKTVDNFQWKNLKEYGRENRKHPTVAEDLLWQELRNNKLGVKARRQHAIQGFIADFAILEAKLVIEIDGGYHTIEEQENYDAARTKFLKEFDIDVLRFTNEEVINNTQQVVRSIEAEIGKRKINKETTVEIPLRREEKRPGDEAVQFAGGSSPVPGEEGVRVYTTRPDTIFGVDFMVLAPEHELVQSITTPKQQQAIDDYLTYVKSRSERERMAEVKSITGAFTGAYCLNPFDGRQIPIWISEYVLAGYGTGAIMAVPCGDQRDFNFAKHFNIPITNIIGEAFNGEEANPTKDAILQNSGFLNGLVMRDAINVAIDKLEELGIGTRKVNYRMRDAGFSRQRYWGEPFPIVYKDGVPLALSESELPVELPHVDNYKPGPDGEGPLANITDWVNVDIKTLSISTNQQQVLDSLSFEESWGEGKTAGQVKRETNTMPGYAGSSWYFLRYMDPHNQATFVDKKIADYWGQVDLYIGGTEHAVGHLLYSRLWTKVLCDLGYISFDEPYKKLVNQGMIQGSSRFIYRITPAFTAEQQALLAEKLPAEVEVHPVFISKHYKDKIAKDPAQLKDLFIKVSQFSKNNLSLIEILGQSLECRIQDLNVDVNMVDGVDLNISAFRNSRAEYKDALFIVEGGKVVVPSEDFDDVNDKYICGAETEKMSKSKYNVVNPDDIVERFGADTFRMYEMFLGPIDQSKPWDTKGIEGVHRFLRKFWRLYVDEVKGLIVTNDEPTPAELKVLHKTIKKIEEDTERFSFNTAVSGFMIAVNELGDLKCHKRAILEPLLILITPYAPHIAEELYQLLQTKLTNVQGTGVPASLSPGEGRGEASVLDAAYPVLEQKYLVESNKEYPVSINGKLRTTLNLSLEISQAEAEKAVLENDIVQKWLEGKAPKKIIYVKNKMINVVI